MKRLIAGVAIIVGMNLYAIVQVTNFSNTVDEKAKMAYISSCEKTKTVVQDQIDYLEGAKERSERSLAATLASPNATEEQKQVATLNVQQLTDFIEKSKVSRDSFDCSYPPKE